MTPVEHAVILAAGEGKRLRPFTLTRPKVFAEIGGTSILHNALLCLASAGCRDVRIVVGHQAELIETTIGGELAGMTIRYVENRDFRTTNSMYSLSMGLDGLSDACWVIEGDVFFEPSILRLHAAAPIAWYVDSSARHLDGAYVEHDAANVARSVTIVRDLRLLHDNQSKSIGILRLDAVGADRMREWLDEGISAGRQNDYYDLILADRVGSGLIATVDVAGHRWFEVDTAEDLENARRLFEGMAERR